MTAELKPGHGHVIWREQTSDTLFRKRHHVAGIGRGDVECAMAKCSRSE